LKRPSVRHFAPQTQVDDRGIEVIGGSGGLKRVSHHAGGLPVPRQPS
jgi:hypothetical protein